MAQKLTADQQEAVIQKVGQVGKGMDDKAYLVAVGVATQGKCAACRVRDGLSAACMCADGSFVVACVWLSCSSVRRCRRRRCRS
jgi:hypothetical protein